MALLNWTGRVGALRWPLLGLLGAAVMHLLLWAARGLAPGLASAGLLQLFANLLLAGSLGCIAFILLVRSLRRLLWRVRRKLILSYILTGLLPIVLIASLFLVAGTLTLLAFSAYMVTMEVDDLVREARGVAMAAAGELDAGGGDVADVLARHQRLLATRGFTGELTLLAAPAEAPAAPAPAAERLPDWLAGRAFAGMAALRGAGGVQFAVRAVQPLAVDDAQAVLVDLPLDPGAVEDIQRVTAASVRGATIVTFNDDAQADRRLSAEPVVRPSATDPRSFVSGEGLAWFTVLEHTDWESGRPQALALNVRVSPAALYSAVFGAQARIGDFSLGYAYLVVFVVVALLFLLIEAGALVMGLALARSITGAVHELFVGTARVQQGDFTHRIRVRARDQLGDLAESFNSMTASVRDLLQQVGEKKRLEEELRIAHQVQFSLLPRDSVSVPGLTVGAACIPAREVGGDYYDFIRLGERRLGVLVADVSGKGTPAAFYMAELKGLVLSLSRIHESPRRLLIEVNRLLASNIESGRFITMLYAVVDTAAGRLTCARAGHGPLIHVPAAGGAGRAVAPDGLIAGLAGFEQRFENLIEEETHAIAAGDLIALYTDGITEAMNPQEEQFGEQRLMQVLEEHRHADVATVRQEILGGVNRFAGEARQHDDMTLVLLKVEQGEPAADGADREAACAALEQRLGYAFRDKGLLEHALTHRSRAHEDATGGAPDNESLEFLGDAVLDLVIADRLFQECPDWDEGRKSKAKALLVAAPSLAKRGAALGLGEQLLLGRGEERSGGRRKPSLIADAYEAVVAAIYLDGGLPAAERFIDSQFRAALAELRSGRAVSGLSGDHKSALQEWLQARGRPRPEYRVAATSGPDHRKTFAVDVCVGEETVARAEGPTKKAAEQQAAAQALAKLAGDGALH